MAIKILAFLVHCCSRYQLPIVILGKFLRQTLHVSLAKMGNTFFLLETKLISACSVNLRLFVMEVHRLLLNQDFGGKQL